MNYLGPMIAEQILHGPPGEGLRAFVAGIYAMVRAGRPDNDRSGLGDLPQPSFVLSQDLFHAPALDHFEPQPLDSIMQFDRALRYTCFHLILKTGKLQLSPHAGEEFLPPERLGDEVNRAQRK